ncbi:hypothetical protein LTR04_005893 [Oleoguttula sp. CCFEE 6159]|nr:hypothetical protein LTR04_005893 [Oleoguttula sp. CCFEE 6159]
MEKLPRGARLIPPCDRCRRLQMDCLKNLTACAGCTKKHARCAWRDVCDAEVELLREGVEEVGQGPGIAMGLGSGEAERLMRMDVDGLAGARELARRASTTPAPLVVGDTARAAAVGEGRDTDKDTDVDVAGGRTTSIEKAAPEGGLMATAVMTATADETANAFAGDADAMQQDPLVPQRLPPGAEEAPGPKQELGGSTTGLDAEVDTGIALPSQSMAV